VNTAGLCFYSVRGVQQNTLSACLNIGSNELLPLPLIFCLVAANLQKIVDDPHGNKNVTFKLVSTLTETRVCTFRHADVIHGSPPGSLPSRRPAWRSLKFPMILNSSDLRSSASVKSSRQQRTGTYGIAQLHCSQFQKPLLPKRRGGRRRGGGGGGRRRGGGGGHGKLAGVRRYCGMHEDHIEKRLSSLQESHLKCLQCAYTVNGRRDAINYVNSLYLSSPPPTPTPTSYISTIQTISCQYWK